MDISSTAPSFREVLLGRNIIADSISNNGLESLTYGIGNFVSIGHNTPNVHPSEDLEIIGELHRDLMLINNKHHGELEDIRKVSVVYLPNVEENEGKYWVNSANLVENSLLYNDLNVINNKYKNVLGEQTIIDIQLRSPLLPSDTEYGMTSGRLGKDETSIMERTKNVVASKYLDLDAQILKDIVTIPVVTDKNLPNYMTRMTGIVGNGDGSVVGSASNILGNLLGGTTPNSGIEPNPVFEVQGLLGGSNIDDETPLGIAASEGLFNAIQYNVGANLYEETLGNINLNPTSLMMGNDIIVPNYNITVAKGSTRGLFNFTERILGIQIPISLLAQSSSIFQSENPVPNIQRANSMIQNTGRGQVLALFANLRASLLNSNEVKSGYAPGFVDERDPDGGINPNIYAFGDGKGGVIDLLNGDENSIIAQSVYNQNMADGFGFKGLENLITTKSSDEEFVVGKDFQWDNPKEGVETDVTFDKKTILAKTQRLFQQADKMVNLSTSKYAKTLKGEMNTTVDSAAGAVISKGSAVKKFNGNLPETDPDKMFSRTWTTYDRYDSVEDLQKHSGLNPNAGTNSRGNLGNSVLGDNGFVKIAPYGDQHGGDEINDNVNMRNYMFSIENLAWADVSSTKLIPSEIGPGDTLTGKKGRIMWFPPYEMNFNDNVSVNWEATDFIGRGEPMFTYNNTLRTGTLQFKVIIDHPSYLNNLKGESDELINAFFAGSFDVDNRVRSKLSLDEINQIEIKRNFAVVEANITPVSVPDDFVMYFPYNDGELTDVTNQGYENGEGFDAATNPTGFGNGIYAGTYIDVDGVTRNDSTNFGLNKDVSSDVLDAAKEKFKKCIGCKVTLTSYGVTGENTRAVNFRAINLKQMMLDDWSLPAAEDPVKYKRYKTIQAPVTPVTLTIQNPVPLADTIVPLDSKGIKENIKVVVSFTWDSKLAEEANPDKIQNLSALQTDPDPINLNNDIKGRFYNEIGFFKKLQQDDKVVYDSISEKIGFFHPAFHSITPEGFNSRLTFLQQCTRQGPTLSNNYEKPDNLAFGRPPVCILRIGDFYHTKIVIDNMSFTYEPLVWDLNPEGVGVQPMIATVDMQFSFIGGSSMKGPINKLQNAVSFNFFANTEIYDPRADTIIVKSTPSSGATGQVFEGTDPDGSAKAYLSQNIATPSPSGGGSTAAADAATGPLTSTPAPPASVTNPDVDTINNSVITQFAWQADETMRLKVRGLDLVDDWKVSLSVFNGSSMTQMDVYPSTAALIDDSDNVMTLSSVLDKDTLTIGDIVQYAGWLRLAGTADEDTIKVPYILVSLKYSRSGEAPIQISKRAYLAKCTTFDYDAWDFVDSEDAAGIVVCDCDDNCVH